MTRHDVRRWLGDKSLRDFRTEGELLLHFESENLVRLFGNQYSFSEAREACCVALKMWRELRG